MISRYLSTQRISPTEYAIANLTDLNDVLGGFLCPLYADISLPLYFQESMYMFLEQLCEVLLL